MKKSFSVRELSMDAIAYAINLAVGGGWKITGAEVCGDTLYVWAENQKIPEPQVLSNSTKFDEDGNVLLEPGDIILGRPEDMPDMDIIAGMNIANPFAEGPGILE